MRKQIHRNGGLHFQEKKYKKKQKTKQKLYQSIAASADALQIQQTNNKAKL